MSSQPSQFVREYGFKELAEHNLTEVDDIWRGFLDPVHDKLRLSGWVRDVSALKLGLSVPREVRSMFEVCRGALLYGWYFYPLLTLGTEQLFRALEAATVAKLNATRVSARKTSFSSAIRTLHRKGVLNAEQVEICDEIRELRNQTSHPKIQSILPPGRAITFASDIAQIINALYPTGD